MPTTAKLFRNGGSQAVRLPKDCRFEGDEVCIKRLGSAVLIFPKDQAWDLLASTFGQADEGFLTPRDQPKKVERRKAY